MRIKYIRDLIFDIGTYCRDFAAYTDAIYREAYSFKRILFENLHKKNK